MAAELVPFVIFIKHSAFSGAIQEKLMNIIQLLTNKPSLQNTYLLFCK